jgi:hypothetical protein
MGIYVVNDTGFLGAANAEHGPTVGYRCHRESPPLDIIEEAPDPTGTLRNPPLREPVSV